MFAECKDAFLVAQTNHSLFVNWFEVLIDVTDVHGECGDILSLQRRCLLASGEFAGQKQ
jgi:hypothetical protein